MGCCFEKQQESELNMIENAYKAQTDLLELSGIPIKDFQIKNVQVGKEENQYIRTTICSPLSLDENKKPVLVLVHGFASASALFFRTLKPLSEKFYLILIDVIGVATSGRPQDYLSQEFTAEQSVQYFMDYFEKWRVEMGNLQEFYLVGHSFGGYMMGNYATKYHQHIKKLILISPVGIRQKNELEQRNWIRNLSSGKVKPPLIIQYCQGLIEWGWRKKITPFQFQRFMGKKFSSKMILNGRRKIHGHTESQEQSEKVVNLITAMCQVQGTTETAIMVEFEPGIQAKIPLSNEDKLCKENFPLAISFIYGELDWVLRLEKDAYAQVIEKNLLSHQCKMYIIPESDHNMHYDNPNALANTIINDLLGENLPILLPQQYQDIEDGKLDLDDIIIKEVKFDESRSDQMKDNQNVIRKSD